MESQEAPTREMVLELMNKRSVIEKSLQELKQVLDCNGVGMAEDLVDREGYPRQDIDVLQVRHARHKIICLQNDHKAIMKEIEKGLHFLHSQSGGSSSLEEVTFHQRHSNSQPIAIVDLVHEESPASLAGLQKDDIILSFGTVNSENFKSLQDIGSVVQNSVGKNIPLILKRNDTVKRIILTPKVWSGKGFLGCSILPIENIER